MKILIIGATGRIAQETINELAKNGHTLRLFSRGIRTADYPNHEVYPGDVHKKSELEKAIAGCEAIHITINTDDEAVAMRNILEVAKAQSIKRISYVSGATVTENNSWFSMINNKYQAEQALKSSGIPYLIFRPTWFMESLEMMVQNGKANVIGKQPLKLHWISSKDFGKQVAKAYAIDASLNQEFYSYGPEKLTLNEALEHYIRAVHPEIKKVSNVPFGLLKIIAFLTGNKELKGILPMFEYFEKTGEAGDSAFTDTLLGKPEITLKSWLSLRA